MSTETISGYASLFKAEASRINQDLMHEICDIDLSKLNSEGLAKIFDKARHSLAESRTRFFAACQFDHDCHVVDETILQSIASFQVELETKLKEIEQEEGGSQNAKNGPSPS